MTTTQVDTRTRIIEVAARLLHEQGAAAVTTRGVAEGAGVQAPAIYRLFGDKEGLLEAVVEHEMARFVASKAAIVAKADLTDADPVVDLIAGWRAQIDFGLLNPALFRLLSDPSRALRSPAALAGRRVLEARIHRVAAVGRLKVAERRAVDLVQTSGVGVITTILATPLKDRDPGLAEAVLTGLLEQILTDAPDPADAGPLATAVAFRALAPTLSGLSSTERLLLAEWLDRVIASGLDSVD